MLLIAFCNPCRLKIGTQDTLTGTGLFNFSDDARIAIGELTFNRGHKSTRRIERILAL